MTPQESTMLNDLVRKIQQTRLAEKDDEAEQFLQQSLGGNPDSLYILAQTVLVQNIALDSAKAQVQRLQQQVQVQDAQQAQAQPAHATSFLGSLLGRHDSPPPASPRAAAPPAQYYPPVPPPAPAYAPDYSYAAAPPPPSGGSSFLRSAATTAAGVAAGALAFEGVESLLHGFGHGGGGFGEPYGAGFGGPGFGGGGFGGGAFERPVEETVINNNYYDDPGQNLGGMGEHHEREASYDDRVGAGGDQGAQLHDASYETGGGNDNPLDADTLDDDTTSGGLDDDSNYDDGGSFDPGGDDSGGVI